MFFRAYRFMAVHGFLPGFRPKPHHGVGTSTRAHMG